VLRRATERGDLMIRALAVAVLILAALAVSMIVFPSPGFGGRGVVAIAVVAAVLRVGARTEARR